MRQSPLAPFCSVARSAFGAFHSRNARKQGVRIIGSSLLLLTLLSQTLLIGPLQKAEASGWRTSSPRAGSLPTSFNTTASPSGSISPAVIVSTVLSIFPDLLKGDEVPPEFKTARSASFSSRLVEGISSIMAFAAPHLRSRSMVQPRPRPGAVNVAGNVGFDFDGDGKADIGRYHPADHHFDIKKSSDSSLLTVSLGSSGAFPVPGDYDGDGRSDTAIFNAGSWSVHQSGDSQDATTSLGASGDIAVPGDYDRDGITDKAVYTPSSRNWSVATSSNGSFDFEFGVR
jgi:hypothetical protein